MGEQGVEGIRVRLGECPGVQTAQGGDAGLPWDGGVRKFVPAGGGTVFAGGGTGGVGSRRGNGGADAPLPLFPPHEGSCPGEEGGGGYDGGFCRHS